MDSSSNRSLYKSPTPKIARYLHRIQQIMGNRNRTPSPLSSRIKKSLKPSSLDYYLKYQLSLKILITFTDRKHKQSQRQFFNNLRIAHKHQVEKIYRFVSIEKLGESKMAVDSTVAGKILLNYLKSLFRLKKKEYFDEICGYETVRMVQSHLVENRNDRFHLKKSLNIAIFLLKKLTQLQQTFIINLKHTPPLTNQPSLNINPKIKYLIKLLQPLPKKQQKYTLELLKTNQQYLKNNQIKLTNLVDCYYRLNKISVLKYFRVAGQLRVFDLKAKQQIQGKQEDDLKEKCCQFIQILSVVMVKSYQRQYTTAFKVLYDNNLTIYHNKKQKQLGILILNSKFQSLLTNRLLSSFIALSSIHKKHPLNKKIDIESLSKLNKLANLGGQKTILLAEPFQLILQHAQKKSIIQDGFFLLDEIITQIALRKCWMQLKNSRKTKIEEIKLMNRMLSKLMTIRVIQAFSKIKTLKSRLKSSQNNSIMNTNDQAHDANYWLNEATTFLEERKRNQPKINDVFSKLEDLARQLENKNNDRGNQFKVMLSPTNITTNFKLI